jgi:hypothetical protein
MKRGEITGQLLHIDKSDIGLPMRSMTTMKKNERKHISILDDRELSEKMQYDDKNCSFEYYDPSITSYAKDATSQPLNVTHKMDDRMETEIPRYSIDRTFDRDIQNIGLNNIDYINSFTFMMFNSIRNVMRKDFCVLPVGILSLLAGNDSNIKQILSQLNNSNMYYQNKIVGNNYLSRVSIKIQMSRSSYMIYENANYVLVEFPIENTNFHIGFIIANNEEFSFPSQKMFMESILNLKKNKANIYCPAFKIINKLNVNNILRKIKYIQSDNIIYSQNIYFETQNNIYIKQSQMFSSLDLSENFIFYIRFVPNNIILHIGQH